MLANEIDSIGARIRPYMSEKRFRHTLGVAQTALWISEQFPAVSRIDVVRASMLHDVAKELKLEEQENLIRMHGVPVSEEDMETKPAIHSFAAVALIKRDFPDLESFDVLSAVYNHTLGSVGMSTLDKIVFISDFIEPGRQNPAAKKIRDYLKSCFEDSESVAAEHALNEAVIMSIDATTEYLAGFQILPNSRTVALKESLKS